MRFTTIRAAMPALAALIVMLAAGCTREERSINARGTVTVTREDGSVDGVLLEGRVNDTELSPDAFEALWSVVTRGTEPYEAVLLTLTRVREGTPGETDLAGGVVLAVPLPLKAGARYPVGRAFAPSGDMPLYWRSWGRRDLQTRGTAEVALRTFDYRAVGMRIENEFIATSATGFVEVVTANREHVVLRIDILGRDGAGRQVRLQGDVDIRAERYRPPIT